MRLNRADACDSDKVKPEANLQDGRRLASSLDTVKALPVGAQIEAHFVVTFERCDVGRANKMLSFRT